jgi:hypothetical protein
MAPADRSAIFSRVGQAHHLEMDDRLAEPPVTS